MRHEKHEHPVQFTHRRRIKVRPYRDANRPNLKFVVGYREAGKRKRSFFETKEQAQSFAAFKNAELRHNGVEHAEFPTAWRVMAQDAMQRLKPFGKTIADAVQHYVAHLKSSERSCTAVQLVKELLKAKEADGVSQRQLYNLKSRLGYFAQEFDGRMVATISSKEIDDWLRSLDVGPQTRNHYRAVTILAFNFAIRSGYAVENPALGAAKAKVVGQPPGILSVEQASALLVNCSQELLAYIAIGLFGGLRRAELERLDWSEIDLDSNLIEVTAAKSKTAQRRFVTLQPNLRAWLLPLRQLKGYVTPQENFRQAFEQIREAAGIVEWPGNALRHSFASYHLAAFKNAASTALELGHHDSRVTFAHYRELVKPKDAARFWKIRPATKGKVVPMVARA
jgi:integrase